MEDRDVAILGGGPAGYAAAMRVVQLGGRATLIERDAIGGVCLNHGCIPTVALLRGVELLETVKSATAYGITCSGVSLDFGKMMARKNAVVRTLVSGVEQALEAYGVEVIKGTGELVSPSEIKVCGRDGIEKVLRARRIILATGSHYSIGSFPGGGTAMTPLEALQIKEAPRSLAIIGGDFVGCALATIFSRLGTKVSLIEESSRLLLRVDREIVAILEKEFRDAGIRLFPKSRVIGLEHEKDGLKVLIDQKEGQLTLEAQNVIVSEGRKASLGGLRAEQIGLELNANGGIAVNSRMETNLPGVYAAGDVTMEHLLTCIAYAGANTAAENAMGRDSKIRTKAIPYRACTIPEVSSIGLSEEEAAATGNETRVGRFPFAGNGMAAVLGQRTGMAKVIKDARYGELLGIHMIGPRAGDLLAEASLAMNVEGTSDEIARSLHVHPSLSEVLWEAAKGG